MRIRIVGYGECTFAESFVNNDITLFNTVTANLRAFDDFGVFLALFRHSKSDFGSCLAAYLCRHRRVESAVNNLHSAVCLDGLALCELCKNSIVLNLTVTYFAIRRCSILAARLIQQAVIIGAPCVVTLNVYHIKQCRTTNLVEIVFQVAVCNHLGAFVCEVAVKYCRLSTELNDTLGYVSGNFV